MNINSSATESVVITAPHHGEMPRDYYANNPHNLAKLRNRNPVSRHQWSQSYKAWLALQAVIKEEQSRAPETQG